MNLYDIVNPMTMDEAKATSQRLDAKCWAGKHKEGTKVKGGVRVNNCVPNESVAEAIGYESNKAYSEVGPYKRYMVYVTKKKFNEKFGFIAVAVNPRTNDAKFKAAGQTQQDAVQKLQAEVDKEIDVATKVSGAATIDFNVDFVRDVLEMSSNTFYAKIVPGPKLVIAGKEMEQYPDIMKQEGFKASSIRTVSDSEGATKLPAMPLSAGGATTAQLVANGRYVLGAETIDRDGNRVFDLEFDSVVQDKGERMRMGAPAITIGTKRETKEDNFHGSQDDWHAGDNAWSSENHEMFEGHSFSNGDQVELKPEYADKPNEVYTVSQCDVERGRCWIGDEDGRGWYANFNQLIPAVGGEEIDEDGEGTPEGLPHLTKELLTHIVQQVGTEGAHAIIKSLEWGDGAAEELLTLILKDLRSDLSDEEIAEHIVKVKGGYELKSKHGNKNLGKYPTRAGAEKRERQVQYFKHAGESVEEGDDHGDLDAVVFARIDRERKRLADLKKNNPEAYAREMAREKSRNRIPPVSTFEDQGVAEGFFGDLGQSFNKGMADAYQKKLKNRIDPAYHKLYDIDSVKTRNDAIAIGQKAKAAGHLKDQGLAEVNQRLDAKCWKGKHKEGTKIKGGVRVNNCVPNESVEEALSRKDLLKQIGDKLNDPEFRKKPADPTKRWEKGDLYQGPGPDDYGYTGYQGHGMPTDKAERARIRADKKKGVAEGRGIPGNQHWIDSIKRAKSSGVTDAYELYNAFQNVPKRHFLDFANAVGVTIDPAFQRELERAKQKGLEKNLRQDQSIVRQQGVAEMDKSQKGAAGWNIDDYPLGAKGTTAKPTTVKNVVKSAAKDFDAAFNTADKKKPKPVKESYWTRLQNERNTKLNSLTNELKESIKK